MLHLAPLLALIAIAGYLLGTRHAVPAAAGGTREAVADGVAVEYPVSSGWRPAERSPQVPGLGMRALLALAPGEGAPRAGLVIGRLAARTAGPLPATLLARAHGAPRTQIVTLEGVQALRYELQGAGPGGAALTAYALPRTSAGQVLALCYAPDAASAELRTCEGVVRTLTPTGADGGGAQVSLVPDPGYERRLRTALARLEALRKPLRTRLAAEPAPATMAALCERLATGSGDVAEALASFQPPPAAEAAQLALTRALVTVREGYRALARAIAAGEATRYTAARTRVIEGEARVNDALGQLVLLGYG